MKYSSIKLVNGDIKLLSSYSYNISKKNAIALYGFSISCSICDAALTICKGKNVPNKFQIRLKRGEKHKDDCDYSYKKKLLENPRSELDFLFSSSKKYNKDRRNNKSQTHNQSTNGLFQSSDSFKKRLITIRNSLQDDKEFRKEWEIKGFLINKSNQIKMDAVKHAKQLSFVLELDKVSKQENFILNYLSFFEKPVGPGQKLNDYIRLDYNKYKDVTRKNNKLLTSNNINGFETSDNKKIYLYILGHYQKTRMLNLFLVTEVHFIC